METTYPFLMAYFIGVATPIVILRAVLSNQRDADAGCFLNACLVSIGLIEVLIAYSWIRALWF